MTQTEASNLELINHRRLPRRDWILLPLIAFLTICLITFSAALIARWLFAESKTRLANCMILDDPSTGPRGIPNCSVKEKLPETGLVQFGLNSAGYRAGMDLGPKLPGTYRIVMTGSSIALGERIEREESFATLLPIELSRRTGRSIELYNESMGWGFARNTSLRFGDVLKAKPDLILWALTPGDILRASFLSPSMNGSTSMSPTTARKSSLSIPTKVWAFMNAPLSTKKAKVTETLDKTEVPLVLRHFLYQSQSIFVNANIKVAGDETSTYGGEEETGFLRSEPNQSWKNHLMEFDKYAADIEGRAKAANIPFVAVLVPNRPQAALISMGEWPRGYDPYKLSDELRSIILSHGGIYVDICPDFRSVPNSEQYYLPVDGHPDATGHAIISGFLAKELTSGAVPELKAASLPPLSPAQRK